MKKLSCDVVVVGAGITGLTVARELVAQGIRNIVVLEKEQSLGAHASGRNSGVLHAGIYYTTDSLKARFCVSGNRLMKAYCKQKGLDLRESGKVIVAKDSSELPGLIQLKKRADAAGASSDLIGESELAELEPNAYTFERALFSPETAVIRPVQILETIAGDLRAAGVDIRFSSPVGDIADGPAGGVATAGDASIEFARLINAAGSYADRIAHKMGAGRQYRILPFKGTYKKVPHERSNLVRSNIYPVPDLERPFLGVHFTKSIDGDLYVGPTAIPALNRENYRMLQGRMSEAVPVLWRDAYLFARDASFRKAAFAEIRKYSTRVIFEEAKRLIPSLVRSDLGKTPKVGIRPQLVDWETKRLVMDFVVIRDRNALHVLNAISPAFTASMAFAQYLVSTFLNERKKVDAV